MNAMGTVMVVVGCVGVLLISRPGEGRGGASPTGQVGWASWYGQAHEGRKTASGARFSRSQLTAAHRSLPLGTKVQVTNLRTGQQVVVTINDRGPQRGGKRRIIDLSEAAATRVGILARGTARVQVVVVEHASSVPPQTRMTRASTPSGWATTPQERPPVSSMMWPARALGGRDRGTRRVGGPRGLERARLVSTVASDIMTVRRHLSEERGGGPCTNRSS